MPSSKKKRGKQRKAAASARKAASVREEACESYRKSLGCLPATRVLEAVQRKEEIPTQVVADLAVSTALSFEGKDVVDKEATSIIENLVGLGLIQALVDILNEGCNEELGTYATDSFPVIWFNTIYHIILCNDRYDGHRLQIASSIGPMIECIQNDVDREYFKSNKCWYKSISSLMHLLGELSWSTEALGILLEYDGLARFTLECMMWGTYRPDIIGESRPFLSETPGNYFHVVSVAAARLVERFLGQYNEQSQEGKQKLLEMAIMPVVSKAYHSSCETVFIFGLMNLIKVSADKPIDKRRTFYSILLKLVLGNCVDRDVIAGIIELGNHSTPHYFDASAIALLCSSILIPHTDPINATDDLTPVDVTRPGDARFAIAISSGLFEMCLSLIVRFGSHDVGDGAFGNMPKSMKNIMQAARFVVAKKKSSKSLSKRRERVLDLIDRSLIPNNESCQEIVRIMRSVLDIKSTCEQCWISVTREKARFCSKCHQVCYCSRECQVNHWKSSHKQKCKLLS